MLRLGGVWLMLTSALAFSQTPGTPNLSGKYAARKDKNSSEVVMQSVLQDKTRIQISKLKMGKLPPATFL